MSSDPPAPRWRFLIQPRWLGWHALVVAAVFGMLALGDWQFRRAESGNSLSWAYTFEWPIFAIFAIVFWAKTIRDEFHPPVGSGAGADEVALPGGRPGPRSGVSAAAGADGAAGDADDEDDEDLAAYNAYLARLTAEARGHGRWHGLR
ncbi:MAG TPA: hypothetical protein VMV92_42235 [Streptosporangiaceae bacterium]|nr:hypothetical protein [Streptosporangiaceae bacterium]